MDWSSLISGGISGLLGMAGSSIGARQQYKYQQKLMNQQNAFNLDMWNKSNAYNDPSAVAERYANAGFNPAMMMTGQGVSEANPMQSASPSFNMPDNNLAGNFSAGVQNYIGLKNMVADLRKKEAEAQKAEADTRKVDLEAKYQEVMNHWADLSESERIKQVQANTQSLLASGHYSDAQRKALEEHIPQIAKLDEAEYNKLWSDISLNLQKTATEIATQHKISADIALALMQKAYYKALGDNVITDTQSKALDIRIKRMYGFGQAEGEMKKSYNEAEKAAQEAIYKMMQIHDYQNSGFDPATSPQNNLIRGIGVFGTDAIDFLFNYNMFTGEYDGNWFNLRNRDNHGPTSSISPKVDQAIEKMLSMSLSGSNSHRSHRNLDFHNPMMG